MGRFGQSRYKDPAGTPAALRGIREVTDKNKHILLEAVFNGDFIPDHLLPVGIHRCGQTKWRAHLCTVGHKFSGPPRDNVRDACEDRRRFCEENGVNFVLYGKQTHAKGPIGSRPSIVSTFPRLSDYMTAMVGKSGGSGGKEGAGSGSLSLLLQNNQMKAFLDVIDNAKKTLEARIREEDGTATYVVNSSIAALHKRILEDAKDNKSHVYLQLQEARTLDSHITSMIVATPKGSSDTCVYSLCPVTVSPTEGVVIKFVWDSRKSLTDGALFAYLESVLVNAWPPINDFLMKQMIADDLIETQVRHQVDFFAKVNQKISDFIQSSNVKSVAEAAAYAMAQSGGQIFTRKAVVPTDVSSPLVDVQLDSENTIKWNCLSPDSTTCQFAIDCENEYFETLAAGDVLFQLLEASLRQRAAIFSVTPDKRKTGNTKNRTVQPEDGLCASEDDIVCLEAALEADRDLIISGNVMP